MTRRRLFLSITAVIATLTMTAVAAPMATADELATYSSAATRGTLSCDVQVGDGAYIWCSYAGKNRGALSVTLFPGGVAKLQVIDDARDHRGVVAYARWNGDTTRVRTAEHAWKQKTIEAPPRTVVTLQLCLDGGYCSNRYYYKI